jgi:hypothetical protein
MKTTILNLEEDDDIISSREKMQWSKADRILLVYPRRGNILSRRLDLVILKRQSEALGSQLALVSRHPDVRYYAPRLGIPVFRTLKQAQRSNWRLARRFRRREELGTYADSKPAAIDKARSVEKLFTERPKHIYAPSHPIKRLLFFTLGVLAFLSIAASLYPRAEIYLQPKREVQEMRLDINADTQVKESHLSGALPAQFIQVIVEGRDSLPVSGSIQLPDQPAIGYVRFTNLVDTSIPIQEGTIVSIQDEPTYRYRVTQAGTIQSETGSTLDLPVRALTPGATGNLPAESINAIEGALGVQLSVTNLFPIQHGSDRTEPAPSQADRELLFAQLKEKLESTALSEMRQSLNRDDLLIESSLTLRNIAEEQYQPESDQPADRIHLNLQLEFEALVVLAEDMTHLAEQILSTSLPPGYAPIQDSLSIQKLSQPKLEERQPAQIGARVTWEALISQEIEAIIPAGHAIQAALGMAPAEAQQSLNQSFALIEPPEIKLFPSWFPRLPILPFSIIIVNANSGEIIH